ncbi:MAG: phosphopantothenoylcysteine decarboxylase [Planctomycetes bacterium]|nr:phosphopantothenoylcysteine decarboxylase [Planctomycetota bacterium]
MTSPRLLVSAGPSREFFDDVRFLSNASSGRMGIAIAERAARRGWTVYLALGPVELPPPAGVRCHPFVSALDLDRIARELWPEVDAFCAAAAVADYRPRERASGKLKKRAEPLPVTLEPNPDVLANRAREKGERVLVGFALESPVRREEGLRKLAEKGLDLLILNGIENLASRAGDFEWLETGGASQILRAIAKEDLAERIVSFIAARLALRTRRR